jgi:hypothetical protein
MSLMSDVLGTPRTMWPIARQEPCGTWQRHSPHAPGSGSGTMGHVVTSESSPIGRRTQCHGTRHDARALLHREAGLELQDT